MVACACHLAFAFSVRAVSETCYVTTFSCKTIQSYYTYAFETVASFGVHYFTSAEDNIMLIPFQREINIYVNNLFVAFGVIFCAYILQKSRDAHLSVLTI